MKVLIKAFFSTLWEDMFIPIGKVLGFIIGGIFGIWLLFSTLLALWIIPTAALRAFGIIAFEPKDPVGWRQVLINSFACVGVWLAAGCVVFLFKMREKIIVFKCEEDHKLYHVLGQKCPCQKE